MIAGVGLKGGTRIRRIRRMDEEKSGKVSHGSSRDVMSLTRVWVYACAKSLKPLNVSDLDGHEMVFDMRPGLGIRGSSVQRQNRLVANNVRGFYYYIFGFV